MLRGPHPPRGRLSKKSWAEVGEALEEAHPEAEVQLWAEDEARLGLKPLIRRVWAPVGERPIARFNRGATSGPISTGSSVPRAESSIG